jgi:O-methyltransferase
VADPLVKDAAGLYLRLLGQCLTRDLFADPGGQHDRAVGGGGDAVHGETMIGTLRLDNIGDCISAALADGIPGDLMEAGAWRGGAAIFMRAALAAQGDQERRVFVADSFAGMPHSDHPQDAIAASFGVAPGLLAVTEDAVRANFTRYGMLDDRVVMVPGWFGESLPGPAGQLAVLHVDCDLYQSTADVLTAMYPLVSPGGFVIVDDYGAMPFCRVAVDEFRQQHAVAGELQHAGDTAVWWRV